MSDAFENQNPAYYLGNRSSPWSPPSALAGFGALIDDLIQLSLQSGGVVSETISMTAKVGVPGQILAETIEVLIQADGNQIKIGDGAPFIVEQSAELASGVVTEALFVAGALILGFTPPGWLTLVVVGTGSILLSEFIDFDQAIEVVSGKVDVEFKIVDPNGGAAADLAIGGAGVEGAIGVNTADNTFFSNYIRDQTIRQFEGARA